MTDVWGALQQREHNLRSFQVSADREFERFLSGLSPEAVVCEQAGSLTRQEIQLMRRPKRGRPRKRRVALVPAVAPSRQLEIAIAALEKQEALQGQKASR